MDRVINKFDKDQDGKLNYLEFCKALTPKNIIYTMSQNSRFSSYKRVEVSKEQEHHQQHLKHEWVEDMKEVLQTALRAEEILDEIKNQICINGEEVFEMIDSYNLGYITTNNLSRWLNEECGFKLNEMETTLVLTRYDKDGDYKISRDEFEVEVTGIPQEDEADEEMVEGDF
jgi:Ca2+-binding EF-hand superfamily protein